MTLSMLQQIVEEAPPTSIVPLPEAANLRDSGVEVVASMETSDHGLMQVYENGYVVYNTGSNCTVMRLHDLGRGYRYRPFSRLQQSDTSIPADEILSAPWSVGTVIRGEDRAVHSQNNSKGNTEVYPFGLISAPQYKGIDPTQDVLDAIIAYEEYLDKLEKVKCALSKIKKDQRRAVIAYFYGEGKKKDIADSLGMTPQNLNYLKNAGIDNIRRMLGIKVE